ncbi:LysR family transcriptional regulator [Vibrio sp. ZSDZ65]|uniref:LysR family transcriptional regulator n=1 Tax=Vibrio qingdaonensis TaxID=2829491 RepID=A0A9X3HYP9_9VIBR|nr:LysR family transcriptional regulator [Vibrio qingdaonensis]MCW8349025.1 LysR family transcriptional regulator [Vibrio qingdaonensis]
MISHSQMNAFVTVVETGSMSRASKKLNCSQSTVSRLIEQLEDETGLLLFHRDFSSRRLTLTEDGEAVLSRCQQTLDNLVEFQSFCLGLSMGVEPEFSIALPQIFEESRAQKMMENLLKEFPNTRFSFIEPSIHSITELVESGNVDFGFNVITYEYGKGLKMIGMSSIKACIVCHAEHPLSNRNHINASDLESEVHITFSNPDRSPRSIGFNFSKKIIETQTLQQQLSLVGSKLGYALIPESLFLMSKRQYQLARLKTTLDRKLEYSCQALYTSANHNRPINRWLRNYIKNDW